MNHPSNRTILFAVLLTTALIGAGCESSRLANPASTPPPIAGPPTKESQAAMTPKQAWAELKAGNARFASGHPRSRDPLADVRATASGQYPFAVVLSCLDSRQPMELVL